MLFEVKHCLNTSSIASSMSTLVWLHLNRCRFSPAHSTMVLLG